MRTMMRDKIGAEMSARERIKGEGVLGGKRR